MKRKWITFLRILQAGAINFVRNISLAVAAIAVMVVTLTIVLSSVVTNATFAKTVADITERIDISFYLSDSVGLKQAEALVRRLETLPDVQSVTYFDKTAALNRYIRQNDNNEQLLAAVSATNNPIPATITIKPRDLNKIANIKAELEKPDVKALQVREPSYSGSRKEIIDRITNATNVLRQVGVVAVALFSLICALIIFNTIQMTIFNRRDELTIMRLLGASTSYIRGPFIVESAIYGVAAAILSVLLINFAFLTADRALQASSFGLLNIEYSQTYFAANFWKLLTLQIGVGMLIGVVSSLIATRRYLKFKTR